MLDREKLLWSFWINLVLAVGFTIVDRPFAATAAIFLAGFALTLRFSTTGNKILLDIKGNLETKEVSTLLKNDENLNNAVNYAASLDGDDFIRFVRLAVEIRDGKSQKALKEASR